MSSAQLPRVQAPRRRLKLARRFVWESYTRQFVIVSARSERLVAHARLILAHFTRRDSSHHVSIFHFTRRHPKRRNLKLRRSQKSRLTNEKKGLVRERALSSAFLATLARPSLPLLTLAFLAWTAGLQ
jgi:hypothetical protein